MRAQLCTASRLLAFLLAAGAAARAGAAGTAYVVIVNPGNPTDSVDRKFVENAFLKKVTQWPDEEVIRPVELVGSSPVRRRFSEDMLARSVESIAGYWQQRIFSGRDVPPPEFGTDAEVVRYVLKHPGAIGCVSASAELEGAKVLAVK